MNIFWVRYVRAAVMVAAVFSTNSAPIVAQERSLSDQAAIVIVQRQLAGVLMFFLGEQKFGRNIVPRSADLPMYRVLAEQGLITITSERDLTQGFSGWNDWFALTQAGVTNTATITATNKGIAAGSLAGDKWLQLKMFSYSDIAVVGNDAISVGADQYRVISFTMTRTRTEIASPSFMQAWSAAVGVSQRFSTGSKFKGRLLLKYDAFDKAVPWKWVIPARDLAEIGEEFKTDFVNQKLGALRLGL